jgi:hypothetical protein
MKLSEFIEKLKEFLVDGSDPEVGIEVCGYVHMEYISLSTNQMEDSIKFVPVGTSKLWIEGRSL